MELSAKDFQRLLQHMKEDKPNPLAQESLARGRELLCKIRDSVYNLSDPEKETK